MTHGFDDSGVIANGATTNALRASINQSRTAKSAKPAPRLSAHGAKRIRWMVSERPPRPSLRFGHADDADPAAAPT